MKRPLLFLVSGIWLLISPAFAIIDENNNGLSDLWEKAHNNDQLFPNNYEPQADSDQDGWTNAEEAAAGTDPADPNPPDGLVRPDVEHIPATYHDPDEDGIPDILTPETITLTWPTIPGKQYTLLVSTDLAPESWLPCGQDATFIGNGNQVTYGFPTSISAKSFWRIKVEDADTDGDGLTDSEESSLGTSSILADTNDDGIDDATALSMGMNPASNTADADGDGVPDNQYYSVEFEITSEEHSLQPPMWAVWGTSASQAANAVYLTKETSNAYTVADSPFHPALTDGQFSHKETLLADGKLDLNGNKTVSETGVTFHAWLNAHKQEPQYPEYAITQTTQTVVTAPVTANTGESETVTVTTTKTTPWQIKRSEGLSGPEDDPVVDAGNEVLADVETEAYSDILTFPEFWNDYVKLSTWTPSSIKWGLGSRDYGQLIGSAGICGGAEVIRDWFKNDSFPIYSMVSSPSVYHGGGRDLRIKSVRWRWVRFNPLHPFETESAAPPSSYKKVFRLPVTRNDRLEGVDSGDPGEEAMTAEGVIEIECAGTEGGTGWHDVPMTKFEPHRVDDPAYLDQIGFTGKNGNTNVFIQNAPAEIVSKDRMIAGRFTIPSGWEDGFEVQFVNTTTGEDLGTYGYLLDANYGPRFEHSDSRLFDEWEQQNYAAGTLDPRIRTQKVIFCGNRLAGYPIEFYTVFAGVGDIEVRMRYGGSQVGVLKQTLTADAAFGRIIDRVNDLVGDAPEDPTTVLAGPPAPAGGAGMDFIRPLAKRALVPFFNGFGAWMTAQADTEALLLGLLDGISQGVEDDIKLIQWVGEQQIKLNAALPGMLLTQAVRWKDDPYQRAMETANAIRNAAQYGLMEPMKALGAGAGNALEGVAGYFTNWERFKEYNWKIYRGKLVGEAFAVKCIVDSAGVILQGLGDWHQEFCGRMYEGAERGVFLSVPMGDLPSWRQDIRTFYRTFGYSFGYVAEQLLLGHGVGALSKGMAKLGPQIALTTLPPVKALGVRVLPFFSKRWMARGITNTDLEAAEQSIRAAQAARLDARAVLETDGARPAAELINDAISRQPATVNGKLLAEELQKSPKILQTMRNPAQRTLFLERLGTLEKLIGTKLDDVVAKNFTQFYEKKLLIEPNTGQDIFEDFLVAVHTHYVSGQRPILDQLSGNAASLERLEIFLKGPPPFSPWKAGFETADDFGDSSRGLLIQLHEAVHGKYKEGWTNLDILQNGKVVRATGVDLVNAADPGHFVQITTTAASSPDWVAKLRGSAEAAKSRGGTKLIFDVFWLENNGRPAASLQALENAKMEIQADTGIAIEIRDTASKFDHWSF